MPKLTKAVKYENWSLQMKTLSWFPRQLGSGGKWPRRASKHYKVVECLIEYVETNTRNGQGNPIYIVLSCWRIWL